MLGPTMFISMPFAVIYPLDFGQVGITTRAMQDVRLGDQDDDVQNVMPRPKLQTKTFQKEEI